MFCNNCRNRQQRIHIFRLDSQWRKKMLCNLNLYKLGNISDNIKNSRKQSLSENNFPKEKLAVPKGKSKNYDLIFTTLKCLPKSIADLVQRDELNISRIENNLSLCNITQVAVPKKFLASQYSRKKLHIP